MALTLRGAKLFQVYRRPGGRGLEVTFSVDTWDADLMREAVAVMQRGARLRVDVCRDVDPGRVDMDGK